VRLFCITLVRFGIASAIFDFGIGFWPTVLSVVPLARCVVCLSVCHLSSVTFCIVAKRYVLAKKCLKEQIGNHGQKVHFLGRRHISTSSFTATATQTAVFALFLPIQPNDQCWMVQMDFLAANHVRIFGLCVHLNEL